jgi:sigma-B regulation protein RsbQ
MMQTVDPIQRNNVNIRGNLNAGKTMIFGHGFGTDQTSWYKVAEAFAGDYRQIFYDNTGAGNADPQSFSPNKYDNLSAYADDLTDICEKLGIKDAVMVAHSVSGMVSMLAAIKAPQYFSEMIFLGASPRYINDGDYHGGFEQDDLFNLYQTMENNYYAWVSGFAAAVMNTPDRPKLAQNFAQTLESIRPDIAVSVARTIFQSDYRRDLSKLTKPTLLIHCEYDIAVPLAVGRYMHEHIPNSTLNIIKAEGHFPHISAPEEVIKAIKQFLAID